MAGAPLLKLGGFSSLCIFHRLLGTCTASLGPPSHTATGQTQQLTPFFHTVPPCMAATGSNDEAAGAHEQAARILYHYPHDAPLDAQLTHVGFAEGVIDVSRAFAADADVDSVALESRRYTFAQVEPHVWMVLVRWPSAQRRPRSPWLTTTPVALPHS
jgi:hypothetical protein